MPQVFALARRVEADARTELPLVRPNGHLARLAVVDPLDCELLTAREALPALIERGGGSIVIVASEAALVAPPGLAGYVASKTALIGLMRSLAVDYGSHRIRANAVCPPEAVGNFLYGVAHRTALEARTVARRREPLSVVSPQLLSGALNPSSKPSARRRA